MPNIFADREVKKIRCFVLERTWLVFLLVFFVSLFMRINQISARNIWMDEDAQARRVQAGPFDLGLIGEAATQQQPPIDYYLEAIGLSFFGLNELGVLFYLLFILDLFYQLVFNQLCFC